MASSPVAAPTILTLRCNRCSQFIGESDEQLELVAVVKDRVIKDLIPAPRRSWRCRCGWVNVYAPLAQIKT